MINIRFSNNNHRKCRSPTRQRIFWYVGYRVLLQREIRISTTAQWTIQKDIVNDQWVDGPLKPNIGVIWLGEAAAKVSENRLKPGIHRVIYPREAKCRLTMWYEVCTIEQLRNISNEKNDEMMTSGTVLLPNLPGSEPILIKPGETKLGFLKRVESSRGLSASKVRPPIYTLVKHSLSYPMIESS